MDSSLSRSSPCEVCEKAPFFVSPPLCNQQTLAPACAGSLLGLLSIDALLLPVQCHTRALRCTPGHSLSTAPSPGHHAPPTAARGRRSASQLPARRTRRAAEAPAVTGTPTRGCVHSPCPCHCPPPLGGQPPPAHPRAPWGRSPTRQPPPTPRGASHRAAAALSRHAWAPSAPSGPAVCRQRRAARLAARPGQRRGRRTGQRGFARLPPPRAGLPGTVPGPPVGSATRSNGRCALPHRSAPQGAQRKAPAPLRSARATLPVTPPSPSWRGLCGSLRSRL